MKSPNNADRYGGSERAHVIEGGQSPTQCAAPNTDRQLLEIMARYQASGGVLTGDDAALFLRGQTDQPLSVLATWITRRKLVVVTYKSQTYIPVFQFDFPNFTPRMDVQIAVSELAHTCSEFEIARWFVTPNESLVGHWPVTVIDRDPSAVMHAARASKLAALGTREF